MTTAAEILREESDPAVYTIEPTATVFDAVKLMAEKNIGALVTMEREQVVGIVTERDCARNVALDTRAPRETPLRDIMTTTVMVVPRIAPARNACR
jgi:CBS domain-containing protein